jgi:hypothetical protein
MFRWNVSHWKSYIFITYPPSHDVFSCVGTLQVAVLADDVRLRVSTQGNTFIFAFPLYSPLYPSPDRVLIPIHVAGLHPEEAISYLQKALRAHEAKPAAGRQIRYIYAITGTGHHSKNGKDKIGKAVRNFLAEWRYAFKEFSVPGDRGNMGGIIGIDPTSWDRGLEKERDDIQNPHGQQSTKVVILRKEDVDEESEQEYTESG